MKKIFVLVILLFISNSGWANPTCIQAVSNIDSELDQLLNDIVSANLIKPDVVCGYHTALDGGAIACPVQSYIAPTAIFNVRWITPLVNANPNRSEEAALSKKLTAINSAWNGKSIDLDMTKSFLRHVLDRKCSPTYYVNGSETEKSNYKPEKIKIN